MFQKTETLAVTHCFKKKSVIFVFSHCYFYFDVTQAGDILSSFGKVLFVPKIAVITISRIIGGLITGLAFYTGKSILVKEKQRNRK